MKKNTLKIRIYPENNVDKKESFIYEEFPSEYLIPGSEIPRLLPLKNADPYYPGKEQLALILNHQKHEMCESCNSLL